MDYSLTSLVNKKLKNFLYQLGIKLFHLYGWTDQGAFNLFIHLQKPWVHALTSAKAAAFCPFMNRFQIAIVPLEIIYIQK